MMLLPIMLSACAASDEGKSITFTDDRGVSSQPFPKNYRSEVLAFLKTYLNNPVGVRDAVMAEPVERVIGGRLRYLVCLRFSPRESDGGYREPRERAMLFVDGRSTASSKMPSSPRRSGIRAIRGTGENDALISSASVQGLPAYGRISGRRFRDRSDASVPTATVIGRADLRRIRSNRTY